MIFFNHVHPTGAAIKILKGDFEREKKTETCKHDWNMICKAYIRNRDGSHF